MYAKNQAVQTALEASHYKHLLDEGFNADEISELEMYGAESITQNQALIKGIKKWNGQRHVTDGGLYFPLHPEYGQIRLNNPIKVNDRTFKYLGPSRPVKAWFPKPTVHAITEGWKDAAMPTVKGIPTAAIVGVDNIIYCLPKGCETPIIFDSDGWQKPQVVRALVIGAIWTNGKINLFPEMSEYPTGGACEFFKSGYSITEYEMLINCALKPIDFIEQWLTHWSKFDEVLQQKCARVATELTYALQDAEAYIKHLEAKVEAKQQEWINKG